MSMRPTPWAWHLQEPIAEPFGCFVHIVEGCNIEVKVSAGPDSSGFQKEQDAVKSEAVDGDHHTRPHLLGADCLGQSDAWPQQAA
eukprot:scaffold284180_cov32-Tisochrysis_lutea.AAC.2